VNIRVSNLPPELTEEELKQEFSAYGEVKSASIIRDKNTRS
jgi:RNA recognition motif-containing protein